MMTQDEVQASIEQELSRTGRQVVNRNAFQALFAAFGGPADALGRVFLGRQDALDAERQRLQINVILDLLVGIDALLGQAGQQAQQGGVQLGGLIEVRGTPGDHATTGVDISGPQPVTFHPNTTVRVVGSGTGVTRGIQIGVTGLSDPNESRADPQPPSPSPDLRMNVVCPRCGTRIAGMSIGGLAVTCPNCGTAF